jgi:hypothetical protein
METTATATTPIRRLGGPLAALLAAVALVALMLATSAGAAGRTVDDPRFDTPWLSSHARLDITRATVERRGTKIAHKVTMRAKLKPARAAERPAIIINTRGGKRSDYEYVVYGSTVFRVPRKGPAEAVAAARLTAKDRTWRYRFDLADVPAIDAGYGWAALTQRRGGKRADIAPGNGYATSP